MLTVKYDIFRFVLVRERWEPEVFEDQVCHTQDSVGGEGRSGERFRDA